MEAWKKAPRLKHAMAGFIKWLTLRMENLPKVLKELRDQKVASLKDIEHKRVAETIADNYLGISLALMYAFDIGAIGQDEATKLKEDCWNVLLDLGINQSRGVSEEQPIKRWLMTLNTLLIQGRVNLRKLSEGAPQEASLTTKFLGWYDSEFLYLEADAAVQAVSNFCRDSNEPFPIRGDRVLRDFRESGISVCDPKSVKYRVRIPKLQGNDNRHAVLKLDRCKISELIGDGIYVGPVEKAVNNFKTEESSEDNHRLFH